MRDEASIVRQLHRESTFCPPYCPRPTCVHHFGGKNFFYREGTKPLKRFPYLSRRFRCKACNKTFSYSFFFLEYQAKIWGKNEYIFHCHRKGITNCETARDLGMCERSVRGRKKKMARWGLLKHQEFTASLKVCEPIIYDGLENFSFSQYEPNNLHHAVGEESHFTYDFNLVNINRKGAMRPHQRRQKLRLEKIHGKFAKDALKEASKRIFSRLLARAQSRLELVTDRHFAYKDAVKEIDSMRLFHTRVSSKITRNFQNPLYAVNHLDLQIRQNLSAFKRETISFSKHSVAMQEAYVLNLCHRNYMRTKFYKKKRRRDKRPEKMSPAMYVKAVDKVLSFEEFFGQRTLISQVELNEDWQKLYHRIDETSRRPIKAA